MLISQFKHIITSTLRITHNCFTVKEHNNKCNRQMLRKMYVEEIFKETMLLTNQTGSSLRHHDIMARTKIKHSISRNT